MRLVHADALVLRGRARLLEAEIDSAARALDARTSRRNRADAEALAARLVFSEEDLAAADEGPGIAEGLGEERKEITAAGLPRPIPRTGKQDTWGIRLAMETASLAIYALRASNGGMDDALICGGSRSN